MLEKLKRISNRPLCFCGEAAFKTDSEMGIIYDCRALHKKEQKRVCGFHIRQRAWDGFQWQLLKGQDLNQHDAELKICPYFNYTFCVFFHHINDDPKKDIDGAKPKCTWSLNAEKAPFRRPKYLLHSRDLDEMVLARLRARMRKRDQ
ncbi:hypothetical protein BDC45DRAFT_574445 [Circinella umbellata]|nr:hypothetical protein BDC45DRAFT_574445 [Circinella umbellata]